MKIAQIAPIEESVPPKKYGGIELVVELLCNKMVEKGHDVTLFASADSHTKAKLFPLVSEAVRNSRQIRDIEDKKMYFEMEKNMALGKSLMEIKRQGDFDIVHSHVTWRLFPYLKLISTPSVFTLHIPLNDGFKKIAYNSFPHYNYVSISQFQRTPLPNLNYISTIYNGLELDKYSFNPQGSESLFFLGRSTRSKGPDIAIDVAKGSSKKLTLAMKIEKINESDYAYYQTKVEPHIDGKQIRELQEVKFEQKVQLLGDAICLLFTSTWEEPFGLVMIEAMACGTPVVALDHGSVPEIVKDGVTGFIVNYSENDKRGNWIIKKTGVEGMIEAVTRLSEMGREDYLRMRAACRQHVKDCFSSDKMIDGYERVYEKIIKVPRE